MVPSSPMHNLALAAGIVAACAVVLTTTAVVWVCCNWPRKKRRPTFTED